MNIPPILKNKWVLIGGGAIILFALLASKAGGSSSMVVSAAGTSDAEVAASRDITLAQLSAQQQTNAGNLQLAITQQQGQNDIAKAAMDAALNRYAIDAQTAIQSQQFAMSRDIQLAGFASDERRDMAAINSQSQIAKWTLDQATANAQIQSDFQLQYAESANTTQVMLAQMQGQLVSNQLIANRDVTLAGLATQENLAAISASLTRDVTYSNNAVTTAGFIAQQNMFNTNAQMLRDTTYSNNQTQAAIYASMANATVEQQRIATTGETARAQIAADSANYAAKKADHSNTIGTIGKVLGGIAGIFSDRRLKSEVTRIGEYSDGLGIYHYRVPWAEGIQHGVMADEVAIIRPHALGPVIEGYQTVDYRQI